MVEGAMPAKSSNSCSGWLLGRADHDALRRRVLHGIHTTFQRSRWQVSALLHVHRDSASIVEHDLASRDLTLLGQLDKHYKHRCCQGWGFLSTPLNASATTSRSGLLVMEKVLSRV